MLCLTAAVAQTRHNATMRAAADLDTIARRPESRAAAAGTVQQREIYEPERAVRRRNTATMAAGAKAPAREPDTFPAAPRAFPPAFGGFAGLADNFTAIPPDTQGAVGPNHVVTMLNTQMLIQSRNGTVRSGYPISLDAFWSPVASGGTFDPRIFYDASADRWIACADTGAESSTSALLIAASQTGDPGGVWNYYKINVGGSNLWGDFPSLGFNATWVTVSMNMFRISGSGAYVNTNLYVFNKADLYNSSNGQGSHFVFSDQNGEFTAAVDLDNSSPNTLYLFQAFASDFGPVSGAGAIRISKLQGAAGADPTFRGGNGGTISISDGWADTGPGSGDFGPQQGTTVRVNTGDSRLGNCVLRNGNAWCAHTVFLPHPTPTRAAAQWFQIDLTASPASLVQRGRIDDPTNTYFYTYPAIAVNKNNDVLLGYTRFSGGDYPTAEFSYRTSGDPLNAMQPETIVKQGESSYVTKGARTSQNRWGDYSAALVDPTDDLSFWTVQEYAATPPGTRTAAFGTWWAQVLAPSSGVRCTYSVGGAAQTFELSGGSGSINVVAASGCPWQAASNSPWITISNSAPGSGNGSVQYNVSAVPGSITQRSGTLTVAGETITVTQSVPLPSPPTFTLQAVVNAAGYQSGSVAPGELVTLFGTSLGSGTIQRPLVSSTGLVDSVSGGTRVLFDGVAAPMIYSLAGQISAVAPFTLDGKTSTQIQVEYNGTRSAPITVPVVAAIPAIFTADSSGKGQGAILNQDNSINSTSKPAAAGSAISIYVTGAGAMQLPVIDGALAKTATNIAQEASVTIGGKSAQVLYAGAAPGLVEGVVQINAVVPAGVAANAAITVTIGGVTSPAGVTVAVR